MFGLTVLQLVDLVIKYGPTAIKFLELVDPLLHAHVTAVAPVAKQIVENEGASVPEAAQRAATYVNSAALNASYYDKASRE